MNGFINETLKTDNFSFNYPFLNKHMIENGDFLESRVGDTKEILDFSTKLTNPYLRCVGNNERDINIFFLLAEALWIFKGEKDVEFLKIFNTKMKNYSDDGINFHAPYGFRLRHFGVSSFDKAPEGVSEENQHSVNQHLEGVDQIDIALNMLSKDPASRRVVTQIWNSELDLGKKSLDLPCNDLLMLKIRDGKLISTIANRSNDLHWGLTTNVFQFSFITDIMSEILEIELGTQTHNSQSLHIYTKNPIVFKMYENLEFNNKKFEDLYDNALPFRMKFDFKSEDVSLRLREVDKHIDLILGSCRRMEKLSEENELKLQSFSETFYLIYKLLFIYIDYKFNTDRRNKSKGDKLKEVLKLSEGYPNLDILSLAQNFFFSKLEDDVSLLPLKEKMISKSKL